MRQHSFFRNSLGGRFTLLVIGILCATMGVSAFVSYHSQIEIFNEHLRTKGQMLSNFVAGISPEPMLSYDYVTLNEYVQDVSAQSDIVYALLLSAEQMPLTNYLDETDAYIERAIREADSKEVKEIAKHVNRYPNILKIERTIWFNQKKLGSIMIGLDRSRLNALSKQELTNHLISNFIIITILGGCIYIVFRQNVLRPIRQLIMGAERVARGELSAKVPVYNADELGGLAKSFNLMMNKLSMSLTAKDLAMAQLRELNASLEDRVNNRTQALASANQELKHLALHDPLTGLANRSLLQDRLHEILSNSAQLDQPPMTIMMMDLDRFKEVNDTLGHDVGDELLREVGRRVSDVMRSDDTLARLGGDEFAILCPNTELDGAVVAAKNILSALEPAFEVDGVSLSILASLGVAVYPLHGRDVSTLLKCADVAMYVAKRNRDGYTVYNISEDDHSPARLSLLADLRRAINKDELMLYYQPKVSPATNMVVGVEALARWLHPEKGFIPPDIFIPIIEQTGLIKSFTMWVIETALKQLVAWDKQAIDISIAVNLSMFNLRDAQFPRQLLAILDQYNIGRGRLILEITEWSVMDDPERVLETLLEIEALGIKFSVDDFGTGYSSLSYLKKLPVQELKIDRTFVMGMCQDKDDAVIVHSTIELAHNLGLTVVAEGVETDAILQLLKAQHCDLVQGYYIAKPLPAQACNEFILRTIADAQSPACQLAPS